MPAAVARERERFAAYATRTMGGNLLGDLVQEEVRLRDRIVAIDDEAVLLAPYALAAAVPAHARRRAAPRARFEDDGPTGAALLHDALLPPARGGSARSPPLNLWVRTAPRGADHFCWRIDIVPRLDPPRRARARRRRAPVRGRARGRSTRASGRLADNRCIGRAAGAPMSTVWTNGIVLTLLAGLDSNG